jgi:hypothetical protein
VERFSFGGGMDRDKSLDKKIPSDERWTIATSRLISPIVLSESYY